MAISVSQGLLPVSAPVKQIQKPGELRFHLLLLAAAVALGAGLQSAGPAWSRTIFEQIKLKNVSGFTALLAALWVSIVAHELGHLSAALFLNFEVLGFAVGPFRCERQQGKAIFRNAHRNWSSFSISAVARDLHNCWRFRTMSVVAAGPAFTLILFIAAVRLAIVFNSMTLPVGWPAQFWSSCAAVNFFLFLLGLMPNARFARVRNDAALFIALSRNSADALDMFCCHQAIDLALRRIRPEDYPKSLMLQFASDAGASPYTRLMVARRMVEWATDSGDIATACDWDRRALSAAEKSGRDEANRALAESACFDVLFRGNLQSARHRFSQVDLNALFPPAMAERARAAHLIACDLSQRAGAHILRAQYHLPLGIPYYDYERMLLGKLHDLALSKCESRYLTAAASSAANVL
jgi:hypothetical protein